SDGGGQRTDRLARLMPGQDVVDLLPGAPGCELVLRSRWGDTQRIRADIVVLATGFAYELPEAMRPLADRLSWDRDGFPVRADFRSSGMGRQISGFTPRTPPGTCAAWPIPT